MTKGRWTDEKYRKSLDIVTELVERYRPEALALKRLHPSRSSVDLDRLVQEIAELAEQRGITVCRYGIKELEAFFNVGGRRNKRKMAEAIVSEYAMLHSELQKEFDPDPHKRNKNSYYVRMFEAVALGAVCFHEMDNCQPSRHPES